MLQDFTTGMQIAYSTGTFENGVKLTKFIYAGNSRSCKAAYGSEFLMHLGNRAADGVALFVLHCWNLFLSDATFKPRLKDTSPVRVPRYSYDLFQFYTAAGGKCNF